MPDKQQQSQTIGQQTVQRQKLTKQQLLLVRLVELPLASLEERVKDEVINNVALEEGRIDDFTPEYSYPGTNDPPGVDDSVDEYGSTTEDTRGEEITPGEVITESPGPDDIIGTGGTDDDFPPYIPTRSDGPNVDVPIGDTGSFHEDLMAQINEYDVDDKTRFLLEYLIGSLNDQGFIDTPLSGIVDDIVCVMEHFVIVFQTLVNVVIDVVFGHLANHTVEAGASDDVEQARIGVRTHHCVHV